MKFNMMFEIIFDKENKKYLKNINFLPENKIKNFEKINAIYSFLKRSYDSKYLSRFKNLKYFLTASTGSDHIDTNFLKKNKIKLIKLNTKSLEVKKITSTGEFVLTIILAAIRKLHQYVNITKKGVVKRDQFKIYQFKNYTIGLVGFGRISKYVYKFLKLMKFKVIIFDKNKSKYKKNLSKILKNADLISINIPLNQNKNFFNEHILNKCKKSVILVNTSRTLIFNQNDLINFLSKNKNAEYWTDVIYRNKSKKFNQTSPEFKRLIKLKNFYQTPHIGGATQDAMKKAEEIVFKEFKKIYDPFSKP